VANDSSLGEVLRAARTNASLTLRALAKKLNITPSYICDLENDRRVPSEDVLGRVASELKLPTEELMALAGRLSHRTERYMKQHQAAGVLFRRIADRRISEENLKKLLTQVDKMGHACQDGRR
jgi:transcriptional regulator with XRE-family HTH domain